MIDIPAMDPCPSGRSGRHALASIVPTDDADRDVTLYCERCGAIRRCGVDGPLLADRLDDISADEIRIASMRP